MGKSEIRYTSDDDKRRSSDNRKTGADYHIQSIHQMHRDIVYHYPKAWKS